MSLFIFLTVVQAIVAAALVAVILMQRSEGGGLGIGGSPNGMMSARGAADFLSRATKWLAVGFVLLSILLAILAVGTTGSGDITTTLERDTSAPAAPLDGQAGAGAPASQAAPSGADAAPVTNTPAATVPADAAAADAATQENAAE